MHDNLIILAGGTSSRMKKAIGSNGLSQKDINQTNDRSKSLISIGNNDRPVLDYLLFNAKSAGYKNIFLVVSEKGLPMFKTFYGEQTKEIIFHGLTINYVIQKIPKNRDKPFGTADALLQALEQYTSLQNQCFTVCNSDNLYSRIALLKIRDTNYTNAFINYNRDGLEFSSKRIARFAITKLNKNNCLVDIVEKPHPKDLDNYKDLDGRIGVSMNIFKFHGSDFYVYLKNCPIHKERNEKELPRALLNMVHDGIEVFGIPLSEHVPDLTSKEDILVVKDYLLKNYPELPF